MCAYILKHTQILSQIRIYTIMCNENNIEIYMLYKQHIFVINLSNTSAYKLQCITHVGIHYTLYTDLYYNKWVAGAPVNAGTANRKYGQWSLRDPRCVWNHWRAGRKSSSHRTESLSRLIAGEVFGFEDRDGRKLNV